MKTLLISVFLLAACVIAHGQNPTQIRTTPNDPTGLSCNSSSMELQTPSGALFSCHNGHYASIGGGSAGTCASLGGDVTGTCTANTVVKINGQTPAVVATTGNYNDLLNLPPPSSNTPGFSPNQVISGGGVEYISGLTYEVGAATYSISGINYTSPLSSITLAAADPSNPRIDVIGLDTTGSVFKITGTAAANPAQPSIDPSTQIGLIFVLVPAGATTPSGVAITNIYLENTEWTCTPTAHINCASTNNPFRGTTDIEATAAVLTNNFTLVKPASGTTDLSTQNTLIFYIRSKATWASSRNLTLTWLNGSTQVGNGVVVRDGTFGFSSAVTSNYQQIQIPVSLFGTGSNLVTTLKVAVTGTSGGASIGFYIDTVTLQSGSTPVPQSSSLVSYRGVYSSAVAYNPNDLVVSGGNAYVALLANTNVSVNTASTWQPIGGGSAAQLTTLNYTKTSATVATIGATCSSSNPCNVRIGQVVTQFTTPATGTLSGTSATDTAYVYWDPSNTPSLTFGINGAETLTCSGCTTATGITTFPAGTIPLWTVAIASNVWGASGTDYRAIYGRNLVTPSAGITITNNPSTGADAIATDSTVVPRYFTGSGAPSSNCTQGRDFYTDTSALVLYFCDATNTWKQSTGTIGSGTIALTTSAISSATCSSASTLTITGTASTDTVIATLNADPTATTGYLPSTSGSLYIWVYPTANTINAKVCNNTSGSITPGAATLNVRVVR